MTSWTDYQDDISDAISDSMDADWSASVGAKAVVAWLNEHKPLSAAPAPEGGAVSDAIRAKYDQVKGATYHAGTPAERMKDGRLQGLNDALAIAMIADEPAALATREEAPADMTDCKTCRGNGEIVTDWERYLGPPRTGRSG